jgi:lipid-binding SYLF domain-containing protein
MVAAVLLAGAGGCASIPGKTGQEQAEAIESLESRTLEDLKKQEPSSEGELARAVGYVIMSNKLTKIPLVGVGAGYGVAVDTRTSERTYLQMKRFDLGAGWGARAVRPVMVFHDEEKFRKFIDGDFDVTVGAEASAKVGDAGAAGGGAGETPGEDTGYRSYLITDSGVSATASVAMIRVKRVRLKE